MVQRLTDWLVYLVVRVFIAVLQALHIQTCQRLAQLLAWLACDVLRIRAGVIDENLRYAYPRLAAAERQVLARRMWEHLVLMVCEVAHAPRKIHDTNWRRYVMICHKRQFVRCLLGPRPTVLVSGHFGNFEMGGFFTGLLGFPTFTIARPLDNPYLNRFLNRFREATGQYILPKEGSAPQVEAVLRSAGTLAILGDQYGGAKGCWVEFLGRPASCHKAVPLFSLTTGAPLLVSYAKRTRGPMHFEVGLVAIADPAQGDEPVAGVKPLTQWYNQMLEQIIHTAPEQYWWVHRRWKGSPSRRRKRPMKPAIETA